MSIFEVDGNHTTMKIHLQLLLIAFLIASVQVIKAQSISNATPNSALAGERLSVTITGMGTSFTAGSVNSLFFQGSSSSINADSYSVLSNTSIQADFSVSNTADIEDYDVVVDHSVDGVLSLTAGMSITACVTGCIWPGDCNDDGVANNVDFLSIGLAYGSTGYTRIDGSTNWQGEYVNDWIALPPNYKYIDANADGTVDGLDSNAILLNYGLTHSKTGQNGTVADPPLYVDLPTTINAGDTLTLPVVLGSSSDPVVDLYGIAFSIEFDDHLVEGGNIQLMFNDNLMGTYGTDFIKLEKHLSGKVDVALTRINQTNVTGNGDLFEVQIVMIDDLAGISDDTLDIDIVNVTTLTASGDTIATYAYGDSTAIAPPVGLKESKAIVDIYPNPSSERFQIQSSSKIDHYQVWDQYGRLVRRTKTSRNQIILSLEEEPVGVYFIEIKTQGKVLRKKIVKY